MAPYTFTYVTSSTYGCCGVRGEIERVVRSAIYCRYYSKALTGAGWMLRNCRKLAMNQHTKVSNKVCDNILQETSTTDMEE
jgi:hypothetical protein